VTQGQVSAATFSHIFVLLFFVYLFINMYISVVFVVLSF
jgi:hypothetical protein